MTQPPPAAPETYAGAVVALDLPCRQCGYDLRGLRIDQRCPECGFMVWSSIVDAVDPAASRLPQLRNPRRVGDALLGLMLVIFVAFLLVTAAPLASAVAADAGVMGGGLPRPDPGWGGGLLLVGLLMLHRLAPPRGREPRGAVRRDLRLAAAGLLVTGGALVGGRFFGGSLAAWLGIDAGIIETATWYAAGVGGFVLLGGLHGIFTIIGRRSREYRTSRSGRQGVRALMAALGVVLLGQGLGDAIADPNLDLLVAAVRWSGSLMLAIGLAYLVMNAWWIRRSLHRAPPSLAAILRMPHVRPEVGG